MTEEQLKAAETEATAKVEDAVDEISEEDLEGVAGGSGGTIDVGGPYVVTKTVPGATQF